jgi:hypothetical protein
MWGQQIFVRGLTTQYGEKRRERWREIGGKSRDFSKEKRDIERKRE